MQLTATLALIAGAAQCAMAIGTSGPNGYFDTDKDCFQYCVKSAIRQYKDTVPGVPGQLIGAALCNRSPAFTARVNACKISTCKLPVDSQPGWCDSNGVLTIWSVELSVTDQNEAAAAAKILQGASLESIARGF